MQASWNIYEHFTVGSFECKRRAFAILCPTVYHANDKISITRSTKRGQNNTPDGIRVLQGDERQLFVESLGMLIDMLACDEFSSDIQVLEDLTRNQKIATYHAVARALLNEDEPPPVLTAVIEGAVASVYRQVRGMIMWELDCADDDGADLGFGELPEEPSWREQAIAAGRQVGFERLPEADETDFDEWDLLILCLEDQVLWDQDWEMVDHPDASPELARHVKEELGIHDDYFVAIPHDPKDAEAERLLAELRSMTEDA
jgi:hypothetical protein